MTLDQLDCTAIEEGERRVMAENNRIASSLRRMILRCKFTPGAMVQVHYDDSWQDGQVVTVDSTGVLVEMLKSGKITVVPTERAMAGHVRLYKPSQIFHEAIQGSSR